jgi:putative ABC transport system permease protein
MPFPSVPSLALRTGNVPYSLTIVSRELNRYLPAVLAVAFSAVLVAMQCGLLLGFLGVVARPIDRSGADLWVGPPGVSSLGDGPPISEGWRDRLTADPEVRTVEPYLFGFGTWHRPDGGTEQCYVIGTRLQEHSIGALEDLTPELRGQLTRPGAVALYGPDGGLLGLRGGTGEVGEVAGQRLRVAGVMDGGGGGLMPVVYCSLRTARELLPSVGPNQTTYLLARCRQSEDRQAVAERLRQRYPDMAVLTTEEFSVRTRLYWLTKTRAGLVLAFSALLGLVVGAVISGQTLYAATAASLREFAVLRAMGIPRGRMVGLVLAQSFWVAAAGIALAVPTTLGLARLGLAYGVEPRLPAWLLASSAAIATAAGMLSGLAALRSLRRAEPAELLR